MKKFKFSLQKVLEYNTHIQKREKDILSALKAEFNELERQLELLKEKLEFSRADFLTSSFRGIRASEAVSKQNYIKELDRLILLQNKKIKDKQVQIDRQTEKLIEISKEKVTVEKLRDAKYEKYKAAERKSDEHFIEEFVSFTQSAAI